MTEHVLSPRQREVVRRLAMSGSFYYVAALDLGISPHTVAQHLQEARRRLDCVGKDRTELLFTAIRRGEIQLGDLVAPPHILGVQHA